MTQAYGGTQAHMSQARWMHTVFMHCVCVFLIYMWNVTQLSMLVKSVTNFIFEK